MRLETNIGYNDLRLTITDNNNHSLVKAFINCAAAENTQTMKLNDNPYQIDQLNRLKRKYNVIISKDGLPYYGHFIIQYPELSSNVARIFARAYKTKLFSDELTRKFFVSENKIYREVLGPLLLEDNIDTLFWSRHFHSVGGIENKWSKFCKIFGYDLFHKEAVTFKGMQQNIHYFKVWNAKNIDDTFLDKLKYV